MIIQDILQTKGARVHTITPDVTLREVVAQLVANNCGSLVVCEGETVAGIITERDILRACAAKRDALDQQIVADYMSTEVITGRASDKINKIMGVMTDNRIRHLPIVEDGKLAGLISIGDIVKHQHDLLEMENHYLKNYIQS